MLIRQFTSPHKILGFTLVALLLVASCSPTSEQSTPVIVSMSEIEVENRSITEVWLLFEQRTGFVETIYGLAVMNSGQRQQVFETSHKEVERYFISPDGRYVALRADAKLRVIDLYNGGEIVELESGPFLIRELNIVSLDNEVIWSPNSDKFVFLYKSSDSQIDLMLYDLVTNQLSHLTEDSSFKNAPTWSPDGQQVAFAEIALCGNLWQGCASDQQYWRISVINSDGSGRQVIADMSDKLIPQMNWVGNSICRLHWSPDNKHIVFKRFCPDEGVPTHVDLFVTSIDSPLLVPLTNFADVDYAHAYFTAWSVEGDYLYVAFTRDYMFDDLSNSSGFLIFDANSFEKEPVNIEIKGLSAYYLTWSPDRKYVIASLGPEHSFVGQFQGDQLTVITDALPRVSSAGYWAADGYVTQSQNRLIKVMLPSGEISELGIELEDGMTLIGWRQVDVPFK
jgi:dipeptidyl aminopeptidase/acylaminoacyl peptidase